MAKEIREYVTGNNGKLPATHYSGDILDGNHQLARIEVSVDCEAELAVLLVSAARNGILRLDRILPFLIPASEAPSTDAFFKNLPGTGHGV